MDTSQHWYGGLAPLDAIQRGQAATEQMWAREAARERFETLDLQEKQDMGEKNVADMTAKELEQHIKVLEREQRGILKALRALQKVREAEEAARRPKAES